MNVYEEAHKLSQAIKESNEYKEFVEVKKDVEANPELKEIVDELLKVQSSLQRKLMSGDMPTKEDEISETQYLPLFSTSSIAVIASGFPSKPMINVLALAALIAPSAPVQAGSPAQNTAPKSGSCVSQSCINEKATFASPW